MSMNWDDLKLFLDVARLGGLSAAARVTGGSPATLGRRITALEQSIGEPLFFRAQTGYRLTPAGQDLLDHAEEVERGFASLTAWQANRQGDRTVRISAGHWTTRFLASRIGDIWFPEDGLRVELSSANERIDIGHRRADIGMRNARPTEQWLAGQQVGHVAFALYAGRKLIGGLASGLFVGMTDTAQAPSARWLEAHHADRIGVRGNDAGSVRELIAAGAGMGVLPCFIGDSDERMVRVAGVIEELTSEHWIVTHHEERHSTPVRTVVDRIAKLVRGNRRLFDGSEPRD